MNQFYVSIVFIGITLIVISLVWIAYDRKRSHDYLTQIDTKRDELVGIINDAEQMIEELNKFSDYIVTQMELKNEEMCSNLKSLEERVKQVNAAAVEVSEIKAFRGSTEKVVNGNSIDIRLEAEAPVYNKTYSSDLVIENIRFERNHTMENTAKSKHKTREKVIPIKPKYKEVIKLAQTGMNDTEIAKSLKMGKGEVQLVLGMNR